MTDQDHVDNGEIELDPKIGIGVDTFGDPILTMHLVLPEGHGMTPDMVEQLALKLLAAAATARTRAGMLRSMVLDGAAEEDARRLIDHLMKL